MKHPTTAKTVVSVLALLLLSGCARPYLKEGPVMVAAPDIYGKEIDLESSEFDGKVVLVDIWGAWCQPCVEQLPHLVDLDKRYRDQGLRIVGVEYASFITGPRDEYIDGLRGWIEEEGIGYTIVQGGETTDVQKLFPSLRNFSGFPTAIIIGRDGNVRSVKQGYAPQEAPWYERTVQRLLAEETPRRPSQ